jgi:hypothetical protein
MSAFDKFKRFQHLTNAIGDAVQEFVDPDTPDDHLKCEASITLCLQDWVTDKGQAQQAAVYITDVVSLMAGGKDSVAGILKDIDDYFAAHNAPTPDWVHNLVGEFLREAQKAIREFRLGKSGEV